jgi:hypothetical protein
VVNAAFTIYPSAIISVMSYGFTNARVIGGGLGGHVALSTKRHTYNSIGPGGGTWIRNASSLYYPFLRECVHSCPNYNNYVPTLIFRWGIIYNRKRKMVKKKNVKNRQILHLSQWDCSTCTSEGSIFLFIFALGGGGGDHVVPMVSNE